MAHRSPITCVDHHVASGVRATGGYDGYVVAWDASGAVCWSTKFDDLVNDVKIDADAARVAVAVADRVMYILDFATGERLESFGPHGDDVNAVRWSPDGRYVACAMDHLDTQVRIYRLGSPDVPAQVLIGHGSGVFAVAFDHTGGRLATVAEDSTARVWDLRSGRALHVLAHPADPEALDWSPDGRLLVTGCDDGIARVWDPDTGDLVCELREAGAAVRFVRFDGTGERVMLGAYDSAMRVYDTRTWNLLDSYRAPFQWERSGAFTADGVVIGSFGGVPINHPERQHRTFPLTFGINAMTATGDRLIVGRDDGAVVDVWSGAVLARHDTIVNAVALSPDATVVASADYRGGVRTTAVDGERPGSVSQVVDGGPVNSIIWHPDGQQLFSGGYDGRVRVWERFGPGPVHRLACVAAFTAADGPIKSLAWSASADLLVAGSSDGSLSGWRTDTEVWRARCDEMVLVNSVATADAAGTVISASRDRRVRVWNAATGDLIDALPLAHQKSVKAVAVVPDGSRIVTGSYDGTAILWRSTPIGWAWVPLHADGKPGVPAVGWVEGEAVTAGWTGTVARWSSSGRLVAEYQLNH